MKAVLLPLVFAAGAFAQGQLTINTPPNVVECQPVMLTWSGGQAPYFVSVLPGNDPTGQALVDFGQQNGTSVSWLVNQQANTALGLTLRDSTGEVAQSASFTVNPGSSSSCLTQTLSFSGGTGTAPAATGPATTPSVTSATAPAGAVSTGSTNAASTAAVSIGSTNAASTGATSGTSRAASATSAASSATSSSAASANFASVSIAGVIGAILATFFA